MIELTLEQRQAVERQEEIPPRVVDPITHAKYVLVREDVYDRVSRLFDVDENGQFARDLTPHVLEIFGREGWDDPSMDVYNDLDPRKNP
jgi:hypothetical protein